jgi:hypothetical protein
MISRRGLTLSILLLVAQSHSAYTLQTAIDTKTDSKRAPDSKLSEAPDTKLSDCSVLEDEQTMLAFRHFQQFLEWKDNREQFMQWKAFSASNKGKPQSDVVSQFGLLAQGSRESALGKGLSSKADISLRTRGHSEYLFMFGPVILLLLFLMIYGFRESVRDFFHLMDWATKTLYNFYEGCEYFDVSERASALPEHVKGKKLHARVRTEGVAWPANALWRKVWEELTPGQNWALAEVGIADEDTFLIARTLHSGFSLSGKEAEVYDSLPTDWASMTQKQRSALLAIGFSTASWMNDGVQPLKIHEKRWCDLSTLEQKYAATLNLSTTDEKHLPDVWDTRDADLFRTTYTEIDSESLKVLNMMGFAKEKWIVYDDPVPPLSYTEPERAFVLKRIKQYSFVLLSLFFWVWLISVCIEANVFGTIVANFSVYIIGAVVVSSILGVIGAVLWKLVCRLEEGILSEVRVIFQHLKSVWNMMHNLELNMPSVHAMHEKLSEKKTLMRSATVSLTHREMTRVQTACAHCGFRGCAGGT